MERIAALGIVNRLEAAWPHERWTQPRVDQWCDALDDIDEGAAGTVLARVTRSHSKCPTMADFRNACQRLDTTDRSQPRHRCTTCDGAGWIDDTTDARHSPSCTTPADCWCHAVTPCTTCTTPQRHATHHTTTSERHSR